MFGRRCLVLFALIALQLAPSQAAEIDFRYEALEISVSSGTKVPVHISVPRAGPSKLPALLVFGGFEQAAHVLELLHPTEPVLLASFDYPFTPPRKFEFPESLKFAPQARQAVKDTLEAAQTLFTVLKTRADVDAAKISILGASFGAPFATAAAADEKGFSGVVLIHGFGDVVGTASHQLLRKWEPKFGWVAHPMAFTLSWLGWRYLEAPDPEDAARALAATQRVLLVSAAEDRFVPRKSSDSLWRAIEGSAASHERLMMPGDHLQPGSDRLIAQITVKVLAWMRNVGLL